MTDVQDSERKDYDRVGPAIHKVPRRFDLVMIFVVTFAYAVLFGFMTSIGVPIEAQAVVIGTLTLVGIVQMFVSEKHVRLAAVLCGWLAWGIFTLVVTKASGSQMLGGMLICGGVFWGTLLGYMSGVMVAGLFLISHHIRKARTEGRR